jgi:hypothetical protein
MQRHNSSGFSHSRAFPCFSGMIKKEFFFCKKKIIFIQRTQLLSPSLPLHFLQKFKFILLTLPMMQF